MANDSKNNPPIDTPTQAEFIGPPAPPPATIAIPLRWVRVSHKSADHIAARYPYAAYGSNLALGQMAARCPMADPVGVGTLRSARLVFAYYLGIVPDPAATVPIGVYRLNAADVASLDRYEGLGRSYERYLVTVELNGEAVRCFTYIKRDNEPEAPSDRYYATCLQGYGDWQMDARRLRHARDHARKNQKPKAKRYAYETYGRGSNGFSFDDWYKATFPDRRNGHGTAGMGDDFIPEGSGTGAPSTPRVSLVTGRTLPPKRDIRPRYEDMRPDEIRAALKANDPGRDPPARSTYRNAKGQDIFVNSEGRVWIKKEHNIWHNAKPGDDIVPASK